MRFKIIIPILAIFSGGALMAQQPVTNRLRVADSLTTQEKKIPERVILKSEVDSIIQAYVQSQASFTEKQPVEQPVTSRSPDLQVVLLFLLVAMVGGIGYLYFRQQKSLMDKLEKLPGENKMPEGVNGTSAHKKTRKTTQGLETRIEDLKSELYKLSRENEGLNRVVKEYNGIQHEYDSIKHGMLKAYKVRNYPGYDKSKHEAVAMQGVLNTEHAISNYAYEKFLKPVLAIADTNKNSPARTSASDQKKIIDLLVSLSLLYIEYLYLRVNELSIGGKMVERIRELGNGNDPDASLLKKLDTEFGSRALVIKLALKQAGLENLAYPVFDETNLNNQ